MATVSFVAHFPYASEHTGNIAESMRMFGCAGETVSGSVSLSASATIENVEIACTALQAGSYQLDAVDVFLVKQWEQSGIATYQDKPITVSELLVKDDRQIIDDKYHPAIKHWRHLLRPLKLYEAPDIRLTGDVCTTLSAEATKQLWLSIKIASQTQPGIYKGTITVSAEGLQLASLPVELEVLPLLLQEPKQSLFIWYKGTLDWRRPQHYVSEEKFRRHLIDIREQGFRSFSIHENNLRYAKRATEIAEEVGFSEFVLFVPPYHWDPNSWKPKKLKPVYYLSDELDIHQTHNPSIGATLASGHRMNWERTNASSTTMASLWNYASNQKLFFGPNSLGTPDWISLYLPSNREYFYTSSNFPKQQEQNVFYYWPCHMEKPNVHRVLAGLYLWLSKADGIAPYCYQHMPVYPNSPFNDFDDWEPEFSVGNTRKFRQHMTTYPALSGTIATLQWYGLLEGISDLKYLTTFFTIYDAAMALAVTDIQEAAIRESALIEAFLKRIDLRNISIISEKEREPFADILPEEYHQFRYLLANASLRLSTIIKDYA